MVHQSSAETTTSAAPHRLSSWLALFGWIALAAVAGAVGAYASRDARVFYSALAKPPWAPPGWLFGRGDKARSRSAPMRNVAAASVERLATNADHQASGWYIARETELWSSIVPLLSQIRQPGMWRAHGPNKRSMPAGSGERRNRARCGGEIALHIVRAGPCATRDPESTRRRDTGDPALRPDVRRASGAMPPSPRALEA